MLIFVLRKRVKLAVELLWVTNKAIDRCPFLLLQPLWTVTGLLFFWALWVAVLLSLGTAGEVGGGGTVPLESAQGSPRCITSISPPLPSSGRCPMPMAMGLGPGARSVNMGNVSSSDLKGSWVCVW